MCAELAVKIKKSKKKLPLISRGSVLYLRPSGLVYGSIANQVVISNNGLLLAGGKIAYTLCEIIQPGGSIGYGATRVCSIKEMISWSKKEGEDVSKCIEDYLHKISSPRKLIKNFSKIHKEKNAPKIMGIVNTTPDSFSDGGKYLALEDALSHSLSLLDHGADIIDVGGESTRPGAEIVDENEEIKRTIPLIKELSNKGVVTSIDSRKSKVISAALEAGAQIVNDVSALTFDKESIEVVKKTGVPVILMHMQGNPQTMQKSPQYTCAPLDIFDYLKERIQFCNNHGIDRSQIIVDPGIGFGKTSEHNIEILNYLTLFHGLGCPILVGFSRKRFISEIGSEASEQERLAGSLGAGLLSLNQGVQFLRVHDVFETKQAISVWNSVIQSV